MKTVIPTPPLYFLQHDGEMGEIIRTLNWSQASIGTPDAWPQSLRITLANLLHSAFPMFLFWGPDAVCFYNDAYRPSLGNDGKHPAIGKQGKEVWPEIWDFIGPIIQGVMSTGKPAWFQDQLLPIYRNAKLEDAYWTFSYSLALNDEGSAGGVLVTCMETTEAVTARMQLQESESSFRKVINQAPVAITITRGMDVVIESINAAMVHLMNKSSIEEVMGKKMLEVLPELKGQPALQTVLNVQQTGLPFNGDEQPVDLLINGKLKRCYFNFSYTPIMEKAAIASVLHVAVDVTQQVIARRKIEESEAKLRSILNSAPTAMGVFVGPDLIVENPNQLMIEVMAAGPDIEGKSFRQLLSGLVEEDQKFLDLVEGVRTTGQPFEAQEVEVFFKAEKRTRCFNISLLPLRDETGAIYAVLDVSVDVTAQVAARKKVEESEQYARSLFYHSPVAMLVYVGADMVLREANKKMLELLGHGDSIIGKPIMEGIPELATTPLMHRYHKVLQTGVTHHELAEPILLIRDGQPYLGYYDYTYKALHNTAGNIYGVICTAMEVTDRIMAHQKLEEKETALENALEQARLSKEAAALGTFDLDLIKGTMHWDDRCRVLFGISHHQPVTYEKDFVEGLHPDDRDRILAIIEKSFIKAVSNGGYDVEYRTIGAEDGVERWVKAKGKVYFNTREIPVRFIGSVLDITGQMNAMQKIEKTVEDRTKELATANENLQLINKELQRSNANLEEFAHAASHDLKEPIRKITFFTHQLKDQFAPHLQESELRSFSRIENATERMGNLIDDLLLYSHASQRPHETEAVDLNEKLKRVLEDLELDVAEKQAVIDVDYLPVVQGYRRQLQQLFQNLISNALKYSKADVPPHIIIRTLQKEVAGKTYQLITVADNGIGFEQQYADKIFQMFSRLHGRNEYSGTGVGLSIVKKVVENHNGFIQVDSVPGEGSVFKIYLPLTLQEVQNKPESGI